MKRYLLPLIMLISLLVFSTVAGAFEPLPGVPHPDEVDFGGETVTFVGITDPRENFEEEGDFPGRLEEAKEVFNIGEFAHEDPGDEDVLEVAYSRMMAGDAGYDFWDVDFWPAVADDVILDVSQFLPEEFFEAMPPQARQTAQYKTFGGQKFMFHIGNRWLGNTRLLFWNKDLFEREGLPDLYELYENDEWTWEEFREIAVEATRDTSGDDDIDQWGLDKPQHGDFVISNAGNLNKERDGRIEFALTDDEALDALQFMYELNVEEEVIYEMGWDMGEAFAEGNIAMAPHELWKGPWGAIPEMEDEYGIVPFPKGPVAERHYHHVVSVPTSRLLPITSEEPLNMIAVLNFLWRPDEWYEVGQVQEVQDYAADRISHEIIERVTEEWEYDAYRFDLLDNYEEAIGEVIEGDESPAAAMNAIADEMQSQLDDVFN